MTWTWLRREYLKIETKSLITTERINAISAYIKTKIDNTQVNCIWRLSANETANHVHNKWIQQTIPLRYQREFRPCCDLAMVKDDERKKHSLATQRFIHYYHL